MSYEPLTNLTLKMIDGHVTLTGVLTSPLAEGDKILIDKEGRDWVLRVQSLVPGKGVPARG